MYRVLAILLILLSVLALSGCSGKIKWASGLTDEAQLAAEELRKVIQEAGEGIEKGAPNLKDADDVVQVVDKSEEVLNVHYVCYSDDRWFGGAETVGPLLAEYEIPQRRSIGERCYRQKEQ